MKIVWFCIEINLTKRLQPQIVKFLVNQLKEQHFVNNNFGNTAFYTLFVFVGAIG